MFEPNDRSITFTVVPALNDQGVGLWSDRAGKFLEARYCNEPPQAAGTNATLRKVPTLALTKEKIAINALSGRTGCLWHMIEMGDESFGFYNSECGRYLAMRLPDGETAMNAQGAETEPVMNVSSKFYLCCNKVKVC